MGACHSKGSRTYTTKGGNATSGKAAINKDAYTAAKQERTERIAALNSNKIKNEKTNSNKEATANKAAKSKVDNQRVKNARDTQKKSETQARVKNAKSFDNVTSAKLDKMSISQIRALARKAIVYDVGRNPWSPQTESEALRRFDMMIKDQPKTSLKKMIMRAKKASKSYR